MTIVALHSHAGINAASVAAALQKQVTRDLAPEWGLAPVRVMAYSLLPPAGAWIVKFYRRLQPGMGGVHLETASGRPYAQVLISEGAPAASHEVLEMLVDPHGELFITAGGRDYLVEVGDPVEADTYRIGTAEVSNFVLPGWYTGEGRADYLGLATARTLRPGGYVSYVEDGNWVQEFADADGTVSTQVLGPATSKTRAERDELRAAAPAAVLADAAPDAPTPGSPEEEGNAAPAPPQVVAGAVVSRARGKAKSDAAAAAAEAPTP